MNNDDQNEQYSQRIDYLYDLQVKEIERLIEMSNDNEKSSQVNKGIAILTEASKAMKQLNNKEVNLLQERKRR